MIEIGGNPILWPIMKGYFHYGLNKFIICCGYKGYVIKEYFANYYSYSSDITFELTKNNRMIIHSNVAEPWKVTLVDTGIDTMAGGRLKRVQKTAIQPEARFGVINISEDNRTVTSFNEKPKENGRWINGGYMVLEPKIFDYIKGDNKFLRNLWRILQKIKC